MLIRFTLKRLFLIRSAVILLAALLALAACKDDTDKAEQHYQNALALLEEGDEARAMVELRNVFLRDGFHRKGRQLFADLLYGQGEWRQSYSQYLRLIEQYPDDVDVRQKLAEMALDFGDRAEVARHGAAALDLHPDAPDIRALGLVIDYQDADAAGDLLRVAETANAAKDLLQDHPETPTALRLVAHWYAQGPDPARAVPYLDQLIDRYPGSVSLHLSRLRALDAAGHDDAVLQHMGQMVEAFPDNDGVAQLLLKWYASRDDLAGIEALLRRRAGPDDANPNGHLTLLSFLAEARGADVAMAEARRLAAANAGTDLGRRYDLRIANLRLQTGQRVAAGDLHALADDVQDDDLRNAVLHVIARVHMQNGNAPRAMDIVARILADDKTHVQALILRAAKGVEATDHVGAIRDLRVALDQDPRNIDALVLLAEAHQGLGNLALAEQRLAQAFQVSNAAPEVAILFARFQLAQGKPQAAARVLGDAAQGHLGHLDMVALYAQVLVSLEDTATARGLVTRLEARGDAGATALAQDIRAAILFGENRVDDSLDELNTVLAGQGLASEQFGVTVKILRVNLRAGRFDDARAQIDAMMQDMPESFALRMVAASIFALEGRAEEAIVAYTNLWRAFPDQVAPVQRLYALLMAQGRDTEAHALLSQALETEPDRYEVLSLRAYELEQAGDTNAALDIYAALHARNPGDIIVANNYASLLAYFREDAASLGIASQIAGRLVGTGVPAFLDTLGYVRLREGQPHAAIVAFEAAARGNPRDPTIAFNLGQAYAAAGRDDDALRALERGFRLAAGDERVTHYARALAIYDRVAARVAQ
ncbi:MAG: tetratricopeptide repeat protein [Pseudomonadota bacterium]